MLKTLDLFAGVGGITHALRGFATPVTYCEIDPHAQAVLRKLMAERKLPTAPIHSDVATLDGKTLRGKVDLITAGFPCTGMSSCGKQEGFANQQTGLYAHVVRLVQEALPPMVFLENVAPIIDLGLDDVVATLSRAGYTSISWMLAYAYQTGAPQMRRRWFCLAVRPEALGRTIKRTGPEFVPFPWTRETVARMTCDKIPWFRHRLGMMGNSVVPDTVRLAFCWLYSGGTLSAPEAPLATTLTLRAPEPKRPFKTDEMRVFGTHQKGKMMAIDGPRNLPARPDRNLVLEPNAVPPPAVPNPAISTGLITRPFKLMTWATPRRSNTHGARQLTNRCKNDLGTQLKFERSTPDAVRSGHSNPRWVEWLMGFPNDWTALPQTLPLPRSVMCPDALGEPVKGASPTAAAAPSGGKNSKPVASTGVPSSSMRTLVRGAGRGAGKAVVPKQPATTRTSKSSKPGGSSVASKTMASKSK